MCSDFAMCPGADRARWEASDIVWGLTGESAVCCGVRPHGSSVARRVTGLWPLHRKRADRNCWGSMVHWHGSLPRAAAGGATSSGSMCMQQIRGRVRALTLHAPSVHDRRSLCAPWSWGIRVSEATSQRCGLCVDAAVALCSQLNPYDGCDA